MALADGRLDEALVLANHGPLRAHRRGLQLVGQLTEALIARGRAHLSAGRLQQALCDADKAQRLAGPQPQIAELHAAAASALAGDQRKQRRAAQLVSAARDMADQGRLSAGERMLAGLSQYESRAALLMQDLNAKRSSLDAALAGAEKALAGNDLETALHNLRLARTMDASSPQVSQLSAAAAKLLRARVRTAMEEGRLDLAETELPRLTDLDSESSETGLMLRALEQCRAAWAYIEAGRHRDAAEVLARVGTVLPAARWIEATVLELKRMDEAMGQIRSGPLGLMTVAREWIVGDRSTAVASQVAHRPGATPRPATPVRPTPPVATGLPSRFIMQVDGAGSVCVLRRAMITVGPVSSSHVPDLGLLSEPTMPVARIERTDDDYFVRSQATIVVNDRPTQDKLLVSGDRIALSPRCRMSFGLPNSASTTAVLDLTGARYPRADVRRVVLLDRDLVIGPGPHAHVRADHMTAPLVLHLRDGRLMVEGEAAATVSVDGKPMDRLTGIPMGAHVTAGEASFVLTTA
jgi:tetratricopeptide (TPR) repeat protein